MQGQETNIHILIDKKQILEKLITEVKETLRRAKRSRETSQKDANEAPGAMISRYDSAKEESQYLAEAQRQRENAIQDGLASLIMLQRELKKNPSTKKAVIGALLILDSDGKKNHVFLSPYGGGSIIESHEVKVQIVTKQSPLGSALWGLEEGDCTSYVKGNTPQPVEIVKVL